MRFAKTYVGTCQQYRLAEVCRHADMYTILPVGPIVIQGSIPPLVGVLGTFHDTPVDFSYAKVFSPCQVPFTPLFGTQARYESALEREMGGWLSCLKEHLHFNFPVCLVGSLELLFRANQLSLSVCHRSI